MVNLRISSFEESLDVCILSIVSSKIVALNRHWLKITLFQYLSTISTTIIF